MTEYKATMAIGSAATRESVPELEFTDMLSMFRACASTRADAPAIIYFDRSISYSELDEASNALASWLLTVGVGAGDRVAIILQNMPQFVMMTIAAWKIGAIPLPINPMYKSGELTRIFADAEPDAYLCLDTHVDEVRKALAAVDQSNRPVLVTSARSFQSRDDARVLPPTPNAGTDDLRLEDIIQRFSGSILPEIAIDGSQLGLLLYTSGTTGLPKGAMIRHSSLVFNAQTFRDWCALGSQSRILAMAPFFHITGFAGLLTTVFSAQAALILHYRVEPSLVLDVIREHRPTLTSAAVTAFNALINVPGLTPEDMASFNQIFSGGAPIPPALRDNIQEAFGQRLYCGYGLTETAAQTHMAPLGADIPVDPASGTLSIGVVIPRTEAKIVNDAGEQAAVGEAGELLVRGPQVMAGYWRKPQETAEALQDGWFRTGDIAFVDAAGWYYLVDRKKDVIIASGFKVWPREVEDMLYSHPAVREVAVVGEPDAYRGENVKAFVSLRDGCSADPADLIAHCRQNLAAYKVPRSIEILAELPKTVTGKIQRMALRVPPTTA